MSIQLKLLSLDINQLSTELVELSKEQAWLENGKFNGKLYNLYTKYTDIAAEFLCNDKLLEQLIDIKDFITDLTTIRDAVITKINTEMDMITAMMFIEGVSNKIYHLANKQIPANVIKPILFKPLTDNLKQYFNKNENNAINAIKYFNQDLDEYLPIDYEDSYWCPIHNNGNNEDINQQFLTWIIDAHPRLVSIKNSLDMFSTESNINNYLGLFLNILQTNQDKNLVLPETDFSF